MAKKILLGMQVPVRLSFDDLGEPKGYQDKPPLRWASTFLVPYGSPDVKAMEALIEEVAQDKWGKKYRAILDEILVDKKGCFWIDGKRKAYDGYEGHWAATAYRYEKDGRPLVLDNDASPIYKPDNSLYEGKGGRLFGGCYVRGEIEVWCQDNSNGKGIRATLLQVQRVKKGDSFGGSSQPVAGVLNAIADDEDEESLA